METRNPGEHGDTGTGEVHSHLSQSGRGAGMSGESPIGGSSAGYGSGATRQAGTVADQARDKAEDVMDQARDRAGELRDRAEEVAGQARTRANEAIHRAEHELEDRTGVITMIRDNPLPALGAALAIGYLAAGSRRSKRGRVMNMATGQLRGAVMAGISAALARELRNIVKEQGGSLASLFGDDDDTGAPRRPTTTRSSGLDTGTPSSF